MKGIINRISFALISNIVGFLVSTIVVLIVPKFIDVSQYAYFQLYIFYVGYIGFINLGWPEGIMLRFGGKKYDELDKEGLKTEITCFSILTSIIGLILILISLFNYNNVDSKFVWIGVGLCIMIYLPRAFMQVLLHMTNRVNEYSVSIIIEKLVYFFIVIGLLFANKKQYPFYIIAELIGRFFALIYIAYQTRDILTTKGRKIVNQVKEIIINIRVGIKLMLANLAGLFIIGIVRQCIGLKWDIETFGKVSLTLSISNMLIVFIRAVAIVIFPILKRMKESELPTLYRKIRLSLVTPLFALLILYYPAKEILCIWLPQYAESLYFMAILFPICIYECKTSLLIETYMKTLRMEKKLLIVNVITVAVSFVLSMFSIFMLEDLELGVLTILIVVAFRCIVSELLLSQRINIGIFKDIVIETALVISFVFCNWKIGGILGVILYICIFIIFIILNRKDIMHMINLLKKSMHKGIEDEKN